MSHEHPQTIALILSQLEAAQSGAILALFPERLQADAAPHRMATMEPIPPNASGILKRAWNLRCAI